MANTVYEGPGKVYIGANLLAEATRVRLQINGNNRRVRTMQKGAAGRSRGAVDSEGTIDNAIPLAGLEEEFIEKVIDNADVRLVVDVAGKLVQVDGWLEDVEITQGVDDTATATANFLGGVPKLSS